MGGWENSPFEQIIYKIKCGKIFWDILAAPSPKKKQGGTTKFFKKSFFNGGVI